MSDYYDDQDLARFGEVGKASPELFESFLAWYARATGGPGVLTQRERALIGLAVAHALQCPYCIDSFTQKGLESGVDLEQMTEAVHVAAALKAGACLVHGVQMRNRHDSMSL
ncbi:MAG: arsenosugar biosynthesis-associated peroxidase-like protein [Planctomycetota bacterium]